MPDGGIREVPSYEAVLYAMRASALKGNVHAQKSYLDFLRKTEQERLTIHAMLLASQLTLKVEQEIKLRKWKESDKAEKNFFVHPDDIEIDPKLGNVAFTAPILAAEKEAREKLIEYRDCLGAFLDPSSSILRVMKLDGNYEKKIADLIQSYDEANALLPLGLRKERSK